MEKKGVLFHLTTYSSSSREVRRETQGRTVNEGTDTEAFKELSLSIAPIAGSVLFLIAPIDKQLRDDIACSDMGPLPSIMSTKMYYRLASMPTWGGVISFN